MIGLHRGLFNGTQVPACRWVLASNTQHGKFRNRGGQTRDSDARKMGPMTHRTHKELAEEEIVDVIARTYHAWRGEDGAEEYQDVPGFCKSTTLAEIAAN